MKTLYPHLLNDICDPIANLISVHTDKFRKTSLSYYDSVCRAAPGKASGSAKQLDDMDATAFRQMALLSCPWKAFL